MRLTITNHENNEKKMLYSRLFFASEFSKGIDKPQEKMTQAELFEEDDALDKPLGWEKGQSWEGGKAYLYIGDNNEVINKCIMPHIKHANKDLIPSETPAPPPKTDTKPKFQNFVFKREPAPQYEVGCEPDPETIHQFEVEPVTENTDKVTPDPKKRRLSTDQYPTRDTKTARRQDGLTYMPELRYVCEFLIWDELEKKYTVFDTVKGGVGHNRYDPLQGISSCT